MRKWTGVFTIIRYQSKSVLSQRLQMSEASHINRYMSVSDQINQFLLLNQFVIEITNCMVSKFFKINKLYKQFMFLIKSDYNSNK